MEKSLRDILRDTLALNEIKSLYGSYDIVGEIAVIRVPENLEDRTQAIADALLKVQKHVKTVLAQVSPVEGDCRLRGLEWVAGEKRTETVHKEFGCSFRVDLATCYFSPRLSYERMRIAKLAQPNEVVVNMFAGVGCYSVILAKYSSPEKVYSVDINPAAIGFLKQNARLNRVEAKVQSILGDAKAIIEEKLLGKADRIIMPLPEKALEYLPAALSALKKTGGWIYYYDFQHAYENEDPVEKTEQKVAEKLDSLGAKHLFTCGRVIRSTGPNWYQTVLDIQVTDYPSKS